MPAASSTVPNRKACGRSRIGNGTELLPFVDGRSTWARFMRDTYNSVLNHCGGEAYASELKRMQAQHRAAGEEPPASVIDQYTRIANGQRRHCEALGWERTARDVTPSLTSYIQGKAKAVGHDD